ncbi:hypothetical protein BG004_003462 [Podila humilis]|nr:hypothetical protein BG004_003462 [Podila humilis]
MASSGDYLRVSDLLKPATALQAQLDRIDKAVIRGSAKSPLRTKPTLFETTVLAFREIIVRRLWKTDGQFQSELDFCKHEWNISRSRRVELIECAELLVELSSIPTRPITELVCQVIMVWAAKYQQREPSLEVGKSAISAKIWTSVLEAWRSFRGLKDGDKIDVENITPEFVQAALSNLEQAHSQKQQRQLQQQQLIQFQQQQTLQLEQQFLRQIQRSPSGPPQLDPAYFEGSITGSPISIPFPEVMEYDSWRIPTTVNDIPGYVPIQSCFMHVPIVPSKRVIETDTEVIVLDDVRLCGQMNAKLWEEFSSGNVVEAISIVPASATWFPKTELADWPCVVMSGLKFEQVNIEANEKDLGVSPPSTAGTSSVSNGQHRWIAGFRRLSKALGPGTVLGLASTAGPSSSILNQSSQGQGGEKDESLDPEFDDIYSIRPPNKKPRLERIGRPSDGRAAWHHSKRRKMGEHEFSKLKDHDTLDRKRCSDDDMSE